MNVESLVYGRGADIADAHRWGSPKSGSRNSWRAERTENMIRELDSRMLPEIQATLAGAWHSHRPSFVRTSRLTFHRLGQAVSPIRR